MKRIIAVLAVAALACGVAFAEGFDVNWENERNVNEYSPRTVSNFGTGNEGNIGFVTDIINRDYYGNTLDLRLTGLTEGTWLLNENTDVNFSIGGLENIDWAELNGLDGSYGDPSYITIGMTFVEPVVEDDPELGGDGPWGGYYDPMASNYDFDIALDFGMTVGDFIACGLNIKGSDYAFEPYLGMTITEMTVNIHNEKANQTNPVGMQLTADIVDNNAEAEVPEPATYAYGVMGLASLLGMKRRIKK